MARTSPYGQYVASIQSPALPSWVMNGDFGDIEKSWMTTDGNAAQIEKLRLENDQAQAQLQKAQEAQDYLDTVGQQLQQQKPSSLRDMYETIGQTALDKGRVGDYREVQEKLAAQDEQDKKDRIQAITNTPSLLKAGMTEGARDVLSQFGVDPSMFVNNESIMRNTPKPKAEKAVKDTTKAFFNSDTGDVKFVDTKNEAEIEAALKSGYRQGLTPKASKVDPIAALLGEMDPTAKQEQIVKDIPTKYGGPQAQPGNAGRMSFEEFQQWKRSQGR